MNVCLLNISLWIDYKCYTYPFSFSLFSALNNDNFHCFRTLVKKDADIDARIYTGYSALHLAAEKGSADSVNLLLMVKCIRVC